MVSSGHLPRLVMRLTIRTSYHHTGPEMASEVLQTTEASHAHAALPLTTHHDEQFTRCPRDKKTRKRRGEAEGCGEIPRGSCGGA